METEIAMEHTIKAIKVLINGMGANKTQKVVLKAGQSAMYMPLVWQELQCNTLFDC